MSDIEPQAVEDLLDAAFGTDRCGRTAYRIREGVDAVPALSFALVEDGALIGTIQCWPVALRTPDADDIPLVMVGPVAIRPGEIVAAVRSLLAPVEAPVTVED